MVQALHQKYKVQTTENYITEIKKLKHKGDGIDFTRVRKRSYHETRITNVSFNLETASSAVNETPPPWKSILPPHLFFRCYFMECFASTIETLPPFTVTNDWKYIHLRIFASGIAQTCQKYILCWTAQRERQTLLNHFGTPEINPTSSPPFYQESSIHSRFSGENLNDWDWLL